MSDLPTDASIFSRITPWLVSAKVEKSMSALALSHDTGVVRRKSGSAMCAVSSRTCPFASVTLSPLCSRKAQRLRASCSLVASCSKQSESMRSETPFSAM